VSRDVLITRSPGVARADEVLRPEALAFLAALDRGFEPARRRLLDARTERREAFASGELPSFSEVTRSVRGGDWRVPPAPADLTDRRVEITGPTDRKLMINALNSGARVYMADHEDATSPTWANVVEGQVNIADAVRGTLTYENPDGGSYRVEESPATLVFRPRGWHLDERHAHLGGRPMSASLFDAGLFLFRNARELVARGSGPYLYLPKLERHVEARLWHDVFAFTEETLGLDRGSIRATVLIETLPAAFEMDEILHALGPYATALNAGRWDYIFSVIRLLGERPGTVLPDRAKITMTVPFMRAYTELLVRTCHRRGAHAIGGMAAIVPSRRDPEGNERAFEGVRADKARESADGFDGTWVAHPDLVPVAGNVFDDALGVNANQLGRARDDVEVEAPQLLDFRVPRGRVTRAGFSANVRVAVRYMSEWLRGTGAVAIDGLMEDAATAEIARSQVWQWRRHGVRLEDGSVVDDAAIRDAEHEVLMDVAAEIGQGGLEAARFPQARDLFHRVATEDPMVEFFTVPGDRLLA
jgi:malate synthase